MDFAPAGSGSDATPSINTAPSDLASWVKALDACDLPVLSETVMHIDALGSVEDDVDARMIAQGIVEDPLMSLKLLRHVARLPKPRTREHADAETTTEALVMLGISPFFRTFGQRGDSIEERLTDWPDALLHLRQAIKLAQRAARFALAFAIHRQDQDAAVVHQATLLNDFAELLLWVHAPTLATELADRQRREPNLPVAEAQHAVLNLSLVDLHRGLVQCWRLPDLLTRLADDHHHDHPQVRNIELAIRVASHSAKGWDTPELADDAVAVARLLNLGETPVWNLLREVGD